MPSPPQKKRNPGYATVGGRRVRSEAVDGMDAQFGAVAVGGRDRDAVEVVAVGAGVERRQVEHDQQYGEHAEHAEQGQRHADLAEQIAAAVVTVVADERHHGEAERQAERGADEDRVVVDHRHEQPDDQE